MILEGWHVSDKAQQSDNNTSGNVEIININNVGNVGTVPNSNSLVSIDSQIPLNTDYLSGTFFNYLKQ